MNTITLDPVAFDCGDFGPTEGFVAGYVVDNGEHLQAHVTTAFALINKNMIEVTDILTPAARADFEEQLEEKYLRETADPRAGSDDFGRGA